MYTHLKKLLNLQYYVGRHMPKLCYEKAVMYHHINKFNGILLLNGILPVNLPIYYY